MAFFDKIGQTISHGVASVTDTTKSLTSTAKLNSQISSNNNTIKETFQEIGEFCYNNKDNEIDKEKLVPMFEKIDALKLENKDLELKVKLAKGFVPCAQCGADVSLNSAFCAACGAKVVVPQTESEPTPDDKKRCSKCGNLENLDTKFCSSCGTKLPEKGPAAPETIVCPNCGITMPGNMKFCSECGTKLEAPVPVIEEPAAEPAIEEQTVAEPVAEEPAIEEQPSVEPITEEPAPIIEEAPAVVEEASVAEEAPSGIICPTCGKVEADGMKFCSECGTKLEAPAHVVEEVSAVEEAPAVEEVSGLVCPSCGNKEADGVRFCSECGTKLEVPAPVVAQAPAPVVPAEEAPTVDDVSAADKIVCSKCGNIEISGTRFCSECGSKL